MKTPRRESALRASATTALRMITVTLRVADVARASLTMHALRVKMTLAAVATATSCTYSSCTALTALHPNAGVCRRMRAFAEFWCPMRGSFEDSSSAGFASRRALMSATGRHQIMPRNGVAVSSHGFLNLCGSPSSPGPVTWYTAQQKYDGVSGFVYLPHRVRPMSACKPGPPVPEAASKVVSQPLHKVQGSFSAAACQHNGLST